MSPGADIAPGVRELLERLPHEPGVYLLKDREGRVVYVGKAKSLHARVRSYFARAGGDSRAFVPLLERIVGDIETIVTRNEKEALLLENNLIKQHRPRFNVMLRDDKSFLALRLDPAAPYPRLEVTRAARVRDDGARYFGPYHSATDCRQTLRIVNRHFLLRTCNDRAFAARRRPCLQYDIGRCLAPCVLEVDPTHYAQQVEDVTLFLRGRRDELLRDLEGRMREAAAALEYERAARLRDQIAAVQSSLESQQVVSEVLEDQDVVGFYREGDRATLVVLLVRRGKLVGRREYALAEQELPDEEVLSSFVARYYDRELGVEVPPRVLLPFALEDEEVKAEWLADQRGGRVELASPQRGERRRLVELAQRNAEASFASRRRGVADAEELVAKLQRRLRLARPPRRIECYDISTLAGQLTVGSLALMVDAEPHRAGYRHFRIRGPASDDFAALYEVLARRLRRAREGQAGWELPDLIVVDGGKAQLSSALAALADAGVASWAPAPPEMIALAKERDDADERPDRVFLPHVKDPIRLRPNTAELHLLARLRDEAHRFAIGYHRLLRRRRALRSSLEEIPGIGPRRRRALLAALGSVRRVRQASVEELTAVAGMSRRAAETVARYFAVGAGGAHERDEGEPPDSGPSM